MDRLIACPGAKWTGIAEDALIFRLIVLAPIAALILDSYGSSGPFYPRRRIGEG